jgi:hypothetical protein
VGKGNDLLVVSGGFSLVLSFSGKRKNEKQFNFYRNPSLPCKLAPSLK